MKYEKKLDQIAYVMKKNGIVSYSSHSECGNVVEVFYHKTFKWVSCFFHFCEKGKIEKVTYA